jgi:polyhydroxyalkanoate synthesis regulator phasin
LEAFSVAKNQFLQDLLQSLPVPTHKEMDDLYKELYALKKKVKSLEKALDVLQQSKRTETEGP